MDSREQEFWVLALDILRCGKIDNFQKNILPTSLSSLHLLTLPLGSGYLKHSPCVLKPMAALWEQQVEARSLQLELLHRAISSSPLRQAGPTTPGLVQRCSVRLCRRIMSFCMKVKWSLGSLPLKTFMCVVYWLAELIAVSPHFLAPGLDSKSSDNLCCWLIQAKWEAGPGHCWSTGAGCWHEQKQDFRSLGGRRGA